MMRDALDAIKAMPLESWIPILVLTLVGLALWGAGRRLLKPALAAVGLLAGGAAGWMLTDALTLDVPAWAPAVVGAVVASSLAILTCRATVAGALACGFGLASALTIWVLSEPAPLAGPEPMPVLAAPESEAPTEPRPEFDDLDRWLEGLLGPDPADLPALEPDLPAVPPAEEPAETVAASALGALVEAQVEHVRAFAATMTERGRALWEQSPAELRHRMLGAGVVGSLIGFLIGTLAASFSATLVTSFGGAMTWMAGAWFAAGNLGGAETLWLPATVNAWVTWWLIFSVIGLLIQWTTRPKRADKPA